MRPLPTRVRPTEVVNTKAALIAAAFVDYSWSYTPLQVDEGEGEWTSTEPRLTCEVRGAMLTVSYRREGFDASHLPHRAACERGDERVKFRVRLELPPPVEEET